MTISEMGIGDTVGGTVNYGPYSIDLEFKKVQDGFMVVSKGVDKRRKSVLDLNISGNIVRRMHNASYNIRDKYKLGTVVEESEVADIIN